MLDFFVLSILLLTLPYQTPSLKSFFKYESARINHYKLGKWAHNILLTFESISNCILILLQERESVDVYLTGLSITYGDHFYTLDLMEYYT